MTMTIDRNSTPSARGLGTVIQDLISGLRRLDAWLGHLDDQLSIWLNRARSRRQLRDLPDYLLKDLGISRATAEQEARKPFWKG